MPYPSEKTDLYPYCHGRGLKIQWQKTNLHTHYNPSGNRQSISRQVGFRKTFTYPERVVERRQFHSWQQHYKTHIGSLHQFYIVQPYCGDISKVYHSNQLSLDNQIGLPIPKFPNLISSFSVYVDVVTLPSGRSYLVQVYALALLGGHWMYHFEPIHYSQGLSLFDTSDNLVTFTDHLPTGEIIGLSASPNGRKEGKIVIAVRYQEDPVSYVYEGNGSIRIPQFDLIEVKQPTDYAPKHLGVYN